MWIEFKDVRMRKTTVVVYSTPFYPNSLPICRQKIPRKSHIKKLKLFKLLLEFFVQI